MTHRYTRAALTSLGLSMLFLVVYGGCMAITANRTDVGTFHFAWEQHVPFVPLMIIPYLSIDLFFIAAPFLCTSEAERRRFALRIALAIVVAGVCFLLFPLKLAFERPATPGVLGVIFDKFRELDGPYNLAPSLHIALRAILAGLYAQHARGAWKIASHVWFSLIGFSTLLVWQHHAIDIVTGFILAMYVSFIFPENRPTAEVVRNRFAGYLYEAGCLALLFIAWLLRPWGFFLLWPASACAIMCAAYFWRGGSVFHKVGGRLPFASRMLLGPVLIGQWLSWRHYRRQSPPWNAVTPQVWIGRVLTDAEAAAATKQGVTAVLDLTGEFSEARPFLALRYLNLPVLDLTAPTKEYLKQAVDFITTESARGVVYVHCKIGYSRTAAVVGAWLVASGRARDAADALAQLRRARPSIVIRPEAEAAVESFARGSRT